MKELLEQYKDCDTFSLTYKDDNIYVSEDKKNEAINNVIELTKKELKKKYNKIYKKYKLIEFDDLYNEIEKECNELYNKHFNEYDKEDSYEYSFAGDFVGEETSYNEPFDFFWEFYHDVGENLDRKHLIESIFNKKHKMDPLDLIESDTLKNNLIKYEISFYNHSIISRKIMVNYYFKLNNDTKEVLNTFKNVSEVNINQLEDLGLYKKNKVMFSTCTNENVNNI